MNLSGLEQRRLARLRRVTNPKGNIRVANPKAAARMDLVEWFRSLGTREMEAVRDAFLKVRGGDAN